MPDRDQQLPPFTVRVHHAARRVRLRVTARDGLVVTLPTGAPRTAAAAAVAAHREWVLVALERTAERRALFEAGPEALLPERVQLALVGAEWNVAYRRSSVVTPGRCTARDSGGTIVVSGDTDDADACLRAIRRWRDRVAAQLLPPLLDEIAFRADLEMPRLTLRTQRSRWGSYSSRRTVSLNRNLVFLPPDLVLHVIAHEIAHARHANHSSRFWEHLESLDAGAYEKRRRLRQAHGLVPPWAES